MSILKYKKVKTHYGYDLVAEPDSGGCYAKIKVAWSDPLEGAVITKEFHGVKDKSVMTEGEISINYDALTLLTEVFKEHCKIT